LIEPGDDVKGAPAAAVMTFQTWQQLGRDPSVVGSARQIYGQVVTVVGVAPPGFYGERLTATPPAFWMPLHFVETLRPRDADMLERGEEQWLSLIGRLAPGANTSAVEAQMQIEMQDFLSSPLSDLPAPERTLIPRQYLRLAAIGPYGVTSYAVAQRTSEIGIRMALGANRVNVRHMVLRGALLQVALGLAIGVPDAIEAGRLMAAELFGIDAWNPLVPGRVIALLAAVAILASAVPAHRPASLEPIDGLRSS
jgi:hypothetical protein